MNNDDAAKLPLLVIFLPFIWVGLLLLLLSGKVESGYGNRGMIVLFLLFTAPFAYAYVYFGGSCFGLWG